MLDAGIGVNAGQILGYSRGQSRLNLPGQGQLVVEDTSWGLELH
jgi:hypothetical protein